MMILKSQLILIEYKFSQPPTKLINLIRYPIVGSCLSVVTLLLFEWNSSYGGNFVLYYIRYRPDFFLILL